MDNNMTHENNIKNKSVAVLDDGSDNPGVYYIDDARSPNTINAVATTVSIAYPAGIFPHSWYIVGVNRFCDIGHAGFANKLKKCREDSAVPAVIKLLKLLLLRQENPGRNEATQWPLMHDLRVVSVKKCLTGIGISIEKIRRPWDRLIRIKKILIIG